MKAQVLKWGNSLAVRIPKSIAEEARLRVGDPLEIEVDEHSSVRLQAVKELPTLAELVSRITPENRYAEIPTGEEIGKETVEW